MTTIKEFRDNTGQTIKIEGRFLIEKRKQDGFWILYSPQFRTFGYSDRSEPEALRELKKSLDTFFEIHLERGTLTKALEKLGWKKGVRNVFQKPEFFNTPSSRKTREFALA